MTKPNPHIGSSLEQEEEALEGLYVVRSSVEPERLTAEQTVRAYKDLARVERAFRSFKSIELLRPIHYWRADRVRAHAFLCMLAYYLEWHMRQDLAPVLFEDHNKDAAHSRRLSIVAPARRSEDAEKKASKKRTQDDLAVQAFKDLLKNLGTIVINTMRIKERDETFPLQTLPSPLQQRCFHLLGSPQKCSQNGTTPLTDNYLNGNDLRPFEAGNFRQTGTAPRQRSETAHCRPQRSAGRAWNADLRSASPAERRAKRVPLIRTSARWQKGVLANADCCS